MQHRSDSTTVGLPGARQSAEMQPSEIKFESSVADISCSKEGSVLASGLFNGKVILHKIDGEEYSHVKVADIDVHKTGCRCIAISPDSTGTLFSLS